MAPHSNLWLKYVDSIRLNPDYGNGRFRRRIVLYRHPNPSGPGSLEAALEDCNHRFALQASHDGHIITHIAAESQRIPFSTCPGAADALQTLVGHALPSQPGDLARTGQPRQHCTHLFDLLELALLHRLRTADQCTWEVVVEDEHDGHEQATVYFDGRPVHDWSVLHGRLQAPVSPEEQRLIGGGFGRWASSRYQGLEREAAYVLQRGYFVAQARRFDVDAAAGRRASEDAMALGVCFTYQPERAVQAIRLNDTVRDFSDAATRPLEEYR